MPQDQPRGNLAKGSRTEEYSADPETLVKDDVRVLKSVTRMEPVAKNAEAHKRTGGATPQKAIVIGLSPKLAPEKRASATKG